MTVKLRMLACALCLLAASASIVSAQIVNTLRGFDEDEQGWSGDIQGAVALADGNNDYLEFEVAGAIQHQTKRTRWRLLGRIMRRTASGEEIAESRMAHLRHNYRLFWRFDSIAFLQQQFDPFRNLDSRFLAGAGLRLDVFQGKRWRTALGATAMYEREELSGPSPRSPEGVRASFFLTVFREVEEGFDIDLVGFYQPRVDDPSDARAFVVGSTRADLVGKLYMFLRYSAEYDSNPPLAVEGLDQNLRAGLGYDF